MSPPPIPSTAWHRFGVLFRLMATLVESRNGHGSGGLGYQTVRAIVHRLTFLKLRVRRLIAAVAEGRYVPRRGFTRRPAAPRDPKAAPSRDPLVRQAGWLQKLIPEMSAHNGGFRDLLRDPDMIAIIEAGPEALRRSLRTMGRMFGPTRYPILARRRKPAPPKPPPPKPPSAQAASARPPPLARPGYVPSAQWPKGCKPRRGSRKIPA
jgi:hypothetical protein